MAKRHCRPYSSLETEGNRENICFSLHQAKKNWIKAPIISFYHLTVRCKFTIFVAYDIDIDFVKCRRSHIVAYGVYTT